MKALWNGRFEWCFWTLHWYRLIVLWLCTFVPAGRKCPSRWCMAQILIWIDDSWLKQFPADRWTPHLIAQILAQQQRHEFNKQSCVAVRVYLTICFYYCPFPSTGVGDQRATDAPICFGSEEKKNVPLNILRQTAIDHILWCIFTTCAWSNSALQDTAVFDFFT